MLDDLINTMLLRNVRLRQKQKAFSSCLESEFAANFLHLLLTLMSLMIALNKGFRKNIAGFSGRYNFKSKEDGITRSVVFHHDTMKVHREHLSDYDVTITFRNAKALMNYLLSPKPDILGSVLRQDVVIDGNLNYLYKFAYMATHLRTMVTPKT